MTEKWVYSVVNWIMTVLPERSSKRRKVAKCLCEKIEEEAGKNQPRRGRLRKVGRSGASFNGPNHPGPTPSKRPR